jgi:trehalose-phosphatase
MKGRIWEHLEDIAPRVHEAPALSLFLDFDGTLTPLIDDPNQVQLCPAVKQALEAIVKQPDVIVGIISGRELSDLKHRVGIRGVYYSGNHGLEISGPDRAFVEPSAVEHVENLKQLTANLAEKLHVVPGAFVENKGYTAAVHFRCVPEAQWENVRRVVHATLANSNHPFQLAAGNRVFDIRPRIHWSKADAVKWIRRQTAPNSLPMYLGDDTTDEDAFAALSDGVTIKIGAASQSHAQYLIEGPEQVLEFLNWLQKQRMGDSATPIVVEGCAG